MFRAIGCSLPLIFAHFLLVLPTNGAEQSAVGKVTAVSQQNPQLCQVSLGTEDGIANGDRLAVYQPNNLGNAIGWGEVSRVTESECLLTGVRAAEDYLVARPHSQGLFGLLVGGTLSTSQGELLISELVTDEDQRGIRTVALLSQKTAEVFNPEHFENTQHACPFCASEGRGQVLDYRDISPRLRISEKCAKCDGTGRLCSTCAKSIRRPGPQVLCGKCGGEGFLEGKDAAMIWFRSQFQWTPSSQLPKIALSDDVELVYDPYRNFLTDAATAADGAFQLYLIEERRREAARQAELERLRREEQRQRELAAAEQRRQEQLKWEEQWKASRGPSVRTSGSNETFKKVLGLIAVIGGSKYANDLSKSDSGFDRALAQGIRVGRDGYIEHQLRSELPGVAEEDIRVLGIILGKVLDGDVNAESITVEFWKESLRRQGREDLADAIGVAETLQAIFGRH